MPIGKIDNKKLSRNLKTKKAPLRVLPLVTFHIPHREKQKISIMEKRNISIHQPTTRYIVEEENRIKGKNKRISGKKKLFKLQPFIKKNSNMNTLRWILLLIFLYLAAGTVIILIQEGTELLKNIIIYSIIGFFTFFMGYIGWILARDVLEIVTGKKNIQNEAESEL